MFLSSGVIQFVVLVPNNVGNVAPSCQYGYQVQAGFTLLGTHLGNVLSTFWVLFGYPFEYFFEEVPLILGYFYIVGRVDFYFLLSFFKNPF